MDRDKKIRQLIKRDGNRCFYCKRDFDPYARETDINKRTIDHYIPKAAGGRDNLANLRLACYGCNHDKKAKVPELRLDHQPSVVVQPKYDVGMSQTRRYSYTHNEYQIPLEEREKLTKLIEETW